MNRALILGVSGQDGAYLAKLLLGKGYDVHGSSRRAANEQFTSLEKVGVYGRVNLHQADLTDFAAAERLMKLVDPDEVYILSGQSSVGRSFLCPAETFSSIAGATVNILESLRLVRRDARIFNAASTDGYGDCAVPAVEETPFRPRSPYGLSKVAGFELARGYRESFGMFVSTGILSNHESPLRPPHFVTTKIIGAVRAIAGGSDERLRLGNVSVRRDWGWGPEYVEAYWRMLQRSEPSDFIVATGETNALSDFVQAAFGEFGLDWQDYVDLDTSLLRSSEFSATCVDPSKAERELGWKAQYRMRDVVRLLLRNDGY